jgi:flagellar hook-basal body complex protein FliE
METSKINLISNPNINQPKSPEKPSTQADQLAGGFKQILDSLSQSQADSDQLIQKLAVGEDVNIDQLMVAMEQTDINFRIAIAVKERLIDAYREVMRIQV